MASPTTTTTPGLLSLPTSVLLTIRTLLSLPSHHHHPTTTLESHLSLSRTCILLRSLYEFGTPAEEDAFWRDECRKAGFGRPLRRVWVDELREENEEEGAMSWKELAMVLVAHKMVCEIRACVDANRWGGDVARFENPSIPTFHPLYTYLHHSHSSPSPAPLPGKSSAESYIPPRHQQPSPIPPPPPQNTPQSYSPSPSPSAYPPTSSTQSHVHNLLSPSSSSSSSSVSASTTSTSTSSSSTSSSTTLVESNPYPYPSPSPSPPPSKSHSHSHSPPPPPPSSHPTPNTTAPPPTLSLDPSQILSTALPTFPDCRHKLFAPLASHANAACVFVTEPVVGRVRLVRRRVGARFDGGARKMVVKRRCKVPMRSDGRTVWVGRSLVDESDESDSDSDDSSDSEEDEHEEEEEEEWTWAWKVDRPLDSYSFEAGERYGEGNEMEEQEEEEEGEEVVGSVCNPDGVTLLDLNRLLVDVLPRTEHEAIQALTIYADLVSSHAFPDLLDHLDRLSFSSSSHPSTGVDASSAPPPPHPQAMHDVSTPRLRVSSTSTGMGIGNIESELDNALHTSLFADSDPNTPSPASATDIVGEPPALTLEAILRTRKHRGFMADHRYPYVDLFEGWYAGMRLRERELSVAEVQVGASVLQDQDGGSGLDVGVKMKEVEEEKEDREQEQEDEALEIESRALPAYLRRPHGVIESPRHGRVYTFGTHAHAPGFGEDSEEPSSAYALVEAKSSRLRSASRTGMRSRTRSALRPRSVSSVLSSSESSSARSGSAMSTSTNDGVTISSGSSSNDGIGSSLFSSNDGVSGSMSSMSSNDGPSSIDSNDGLMKYGVSVPVSVTDSETEGETETETDADVLPTPQDEEGEFVFTLGMNMNIMNGGTGTGTGTGTVRASKGPYAHGHGFNQAYHHRQSYAHSHQHQHHHYHYQPQHDAWKGGCGMTVTEDDKAFEERIEHVDVLLPGAGVGVGAAAGGGREGGVLEPLGLGLKVGSLGFETEGEMGGSFAFGG